MTPDTPIIMPLVPIKHIALNDIKRILYCHSDISLY